MRVLLFILVLAGNVAFGQESCEDSDTSAIDYNQIFHRQDNLYVNGRVLVQHPMDPDNDSVPLPNATVNYYINDTLYPLDTTDTDGYFGFIMEYSKVAEIEFAKEGYYSKSLLFNTHNVPDELKLRGFEYSGWSIRLFAVKDKKAVGKTHLVARIAFDPDYGSFQAKGIK